MLNTLFVVDTAFSTSGSELETLLFDDYLRDYPKHNEPKIRIINLCDTERYLSEGYYCSLLAEARHHQVIPSVKVINALRANSANYYPETNTVIKSAASLTEAKTFVSCMGEAQEAGFKKLATQIFKKYPAPILKVSIEPTGVGVKVTVSLCAWSQLEDAQRQFCLQVLLDYASKSWQKHGKGKKYRWDMAMLVSPDEKVPPSNKGALSRFVKAGAKLGIHVHTVTAAELNYVNQYDALFIRETTAIDHHTYRLAREAENAGLIVIDDPDSILRCCNKVFLHDAFNYQKVPSLKTVFISQMDESTLDQLEAEFGFPLILKMPEGSFSKGVFKVKSRDELKQVATDLLADSALVLAQEYLFTQYDWRIGVMNGRALYACRYYMAHNHWQIYNHSSKRHFSGGFDALPTFEVPAYVLKAALRAAAAVGNGLYGIDVKELDKRAYVLEVNDNPNIDHGIEDKYLGDELYMQVMSEFLRRLEARGR